ncbi:alpha/beta fold hydrolase [Agromyces atrinae]|uniref:Alpha/beta hydrolase n=1 Tax=Agromyces atrinae TaxID=592376 RepID=A0A4Q2M3A8_9MICO|nr:alpha/beta hydrolase [Agromyces atrinae]NYD65976.1 pimeloyl-ACP methyl ester carboxylesterase [Agromyces atrinae]RXZ86309.1 alpha/beta hydrolase [Agromyces atrinae]
MNAASDFPEPTRIPVNGIELEVFEAGRENAGRPVVLAHGWPELAYTWRHQVPALVAAGYHVIVPNQRGYGGSSRPAEVEAYDIEHLTGDLVGLLDHYGYENAPFIGHDWGAMVVWGLALLHPERVSTVVNLSLPYQERGELPWIELLEAVLGPDYYFVHFNRQPGVADAVLDANTRRFLRNLFRKNEPVVPPQPGMAMIDLALAEEAPGEPTMSETELEVFVSAFEATGFTSSINWYRNLDRNWSLLAEVDPIVAQPALMIYGDRDVVQQSPRLARFVPRVEVATLEAGHWIPEERPHEVTELIVGWLAKHDMA